MTYLVIAGSHALFVGFVETKTGVKRIAVDKFVLGDDAYIYVNNERQARAYDVHTTRYITFHGWYGNEAVDAVMARYQKADQL